VAGTNDIPAGGRTPSVAAAEAAAKGGFEGGTDGQISFARAMTFNAQTNGKKATTRGGGYVVGSAHAYTTMYRR